MKTSHDKKFMTVAMSEGAKALSRGDFPVGAVLVIKGKAVGKINNTMLSKKTWGDHAEVRLLLANSQTIRKVKTKNPKAEVELYTTLEPCLMCLGSAVSHRVDRVIFSCPDPRGGATKLALKGLPGFYRDHWPKIKSGIFKKETYKMFHEFMFTAAQRTKRWEMNKKLFEKMAARWS